MRKEFIAARCLRPSCRWFRMIDFHTAMPESYLELVTEAIRHGGVTAPHDFQVIKEQGIWQDSSLN